MPTPHHTDHAANSQNVLWLPQERTDCSASHPHDTQDHINMAGTVEDYRWSRCSRSWKHQTMEDSCAFWVQAEPSPWARDPLDSFFIPRKVGKINVAFLKIIVLKYAPLLYSIYSILYSLFYYTLPPFTYVYILLICYRILIALVLLYMWWCMYKDTFVPS